MYRAFVWSSVVERARSDARNVERIVDDFLSSRRSGGKRALRSGERDVDMRKASSGCRKPRFFSSQPSAVYVTLPA